MNGPVTTAYRRLTDAGPLVRPTHNQLEVALLPPYGDPETSPVKSGRTSSRA